ncbi:MAG: hypothetical protein GF372_12450, partial [Candidatus Marinimicrobia bacterium]|nr:hypothetical protein [Candidatus Neomarinimicrobiota bacterium]
MRRLIITVTILFIVSGTGLTDIFSQEYRGQLSGWGTFQDFTAAKSFQNGGFRYLPELNWAVAGDPANMIDLQISANLFAIHQAGMFDSGRQTDSQYIRKYDAEPYRWWIRYSTTNLEVRAGLQKINFGPAKLLRSLMWFDRLDPRDPLQLTEGVHALLGRYIFNNNTNIWAWGIYGQQETKGWEAVPTREGTGEFGGRVQYPLGFGDIGITVHSRQAEFEMPANAAMFSSRALQYRENRVALDGFFDGGVGIWFESALIARNLEDAVLSLPDMDSYL